MKVVGIIGGMGPQATADLFQKIIAQTPAQRDQDHLEVLIYNLPQIYDRTEAILGRGPSPLPQLESAAQGLVSLGAELLAIPCNTAHYFVENLERGIAVPIIHMPKEVARFIKSQGLGEKIGLLATDGTIISGVYQQALAAEDLVSINPELEDQAKVMDVIYGEQGIKAGFVESRQERELREVALRLVEQGAKAVIAGCTELTTLFDQFPLQAGVPLISANDILAKAIVREAG